MPQFLWLHWTALQYTGQHCTALHRALICITHHFTTLHSTKLQFTSLDYNTLLFTTLHYTKTPCTVHSPSFFHCSILLGQSQTFPILQLKCIAPGCPALNNTVLHWSILHCTVVHCTVPDPVQCTAPSIIPATCGHCRTPQEAAAPAHYTPHYTTHKITHHTKPYTPHCTIHTAKL